MKLIWRRPPRTKIVVFDRYATQGIVPILDAGTFSVFENRRNELHVAALLHMVSRLQFSWRDYCVSYLRLSRTLIVVTGIDSNATFYSLKHALPNVRFIAVQNGIRGNGSPSRDNDLWTMIAVSPHQPPTVDVVATFGRAHSRQYAEHIRCRTIEIGSSRSNLIPVETSPRRQARKRVGFISNFSGQPHAGIFPSGTASPIAMYLGDREISARDYFAADARVVALIADVCNSLEWELRILGRRTPDFPHERQFFAQACGGFPHDFIPKTSEESSYQQLDACDLIVAIDSTLGYEMIARGSRVLFVAARALLLGGDDSNQFSFGFPADLPDEGPFWTRTLGTSHLADLLQSLDNMSDERWRSLTQFVRSDLMVFNSKNSALRALIDELLSEGSTTNN